MHWGVEMKKLFVLAIVATLCVFYLMNGHAASFDLIWPSVLSWVLVGAGMLCFMELRKGE